MRSRSSFHISNLKNFKRALGEWSKKYAKVIWLDGNGHHQNHGSYDLILAIDEQTDKSNNTLKSTAEIHQFIDKEQDWLFGYFSYDVKNELENLVSENFDGLGFPDIHFFQPSKIVTIRGNEVGFLYIDAVVDQVDADFSNITALTNLLNPKKASHDAVKIKMRIHKDAYFEKAQKLLEHIHRGDVYEANFCQEFYAEDTSIDPWETYKRLNAISEPPFAAFMKLDDKFLLCASPERYLRKEGKTIISQPIKGTAPRGKTYKEDQTIKIRLASDEKERAENIMITDLVRNDLSKSAQKGTVEVKELCKVYTYKQVHQMISTVVCQVSKKKNPLEFILETFPMGSMTGAPKISAMKIIEELEETKRGLYSGAVGYFDPQGNFDFNVVIRSILYNAAAKYVSFSVGSAITAKSDPEKEYQECLLKAKAMRSVLETS
ncbi:MAG: anthranilate synthase component I family protein [Allomuricauda sp.]